VTNQAADRPTRLSVAARVALDRFEDSLFGLLNSILGANDYDGIIFSPHCDVCTSLTSETSHVSAFCPDNSWEDRSVCESEVADMGRRLSMLKGIVEDAFALLKRLVIVGP